MNHNSGGLTFHPTYVGIIFGRDIAQIKIGYHDILMHTIGISLSSYLIFKLIYCTVGT
jgi:hypothetical protein